MKRLFICEKASLAQTVADGLDGTQKKENGSIYVGDDVVTWSYGHILGFKNPQEYDEQYKKWSVETLPIIPEKWTYKTTSENAAATYKKITSLIKECRKNKGIIVNVGDADREGQLLIDEILSNCGINLNTTNDTVLRLYITDPTISGVKRSLQDMKRNCSAECRGSYNAAITRAKADWIVGMSGTRLFSCTSDKVEHIGRVQTPTLALVVKRDLEIENFTPKPFYKLKATVHTSQGDFEAFWKPSENWNGLDDENRIVNKELLNEMKTSLSGKQGKITKYEKKQQKKAQPLPHNLSSLQIEASKKYGFSPKMTLELLQKLYEKKITTYPRSDCAYLPLNMYQNRKDVIESIFTLLPESNVLKSVTDTDLKTKAWDDKKVAEHFAIIPTGSSGSMTEEEKKIYKLIAIKYLEQFLPEQIFIATEANAVFDGELFTAKSKNCKSLGWQQAENLSKTAEQQLEDNEEEKEELAGNIPELTVGCDAEITELKESEHQTTPPKRFTEGSIIDAMTNIHRYINDVKIKELLKDAEGIGTAATRAGIVALLEDRGDLTVQKKALISTPSARRRIADTPEALTSAVTTALWESRLKEIEKGKETSEHFIEELITWFNQIKEARLKEKPVVQKQWKQAAPNTPSTTRKTDKSTSKMVGPTGKSCKCPSCKSECLQIRGKFGLFWKCQKSECAKTYKDDKGKPAAAANGQPKKI